MSRLTTGSRARREPAAMRRRRRSWNKVLPLAAAALLTSGCASSSTTAAPGSSSSANPSYSSSPHPSLTAKQREFLKELDAEASKAAAAAASGSFPHGDDGLDPAAMASSQAQMGSGGTAGSSDGDYTFTLTDSGGVTLDAVMQINAVMRANDPGLASAWQAATSSAPAQSACATDVSRDGVMTGVLRFTDRTPSYLPDGVALMPYIEPGSMFVTSGGRTFQIEMDYGDGADCENFGNQQISPNFTTAAWGVPFAIVLPDLYGPDGVNAAELQAARTLQFMVENGITLTPGSGTHLDPDSGGGAYVIDIPLPRG